jgi:hypothetical protein
MGMAIEVNINGLRIGRAFVRRKEYFDISDRDAVADNVSTYEVSLDNRYIGEVRHRYGDGAWKLTAIVAEFLHETGVG